jgi:hypothetical protein
MSAATGRPDGPAYRAVFGSAESLAAIDEVIACAHQAVRVFDPSLARRSFDAPSRAENLRRFLVAGRSHRLLVALHEPEALARDCPRLLMLLRQFPMQVEIHRTLAQARNAADAFVLADDHSVWHQLHVTQPRAIVALHSPLDALPIAQRFEEIWELSEAAASATTLGL